MSIIVFQLQLNSMEPFILINSYDNSSPARTLELDMEKRVFNWRLWKICEDICRIMCAMNLGNEGGTEGFH